MSVTTPSASPRMQAYFEQLEKRSLAEYRLAQIARKIGYDPVDTVEVHLARSMAERVVGLISVVAPQIINSGVVERITQLEQQYNPLDWRVALQIGLEVAQQKFCTFSDKLEAITVGVRVGFAYGTLGVVSSPLDGLVEIKIKNRNDGAGQYFCLSFAGPIRNAGGTAASWCVIIADYIRKNFNYAVYDPTDAEIKRCQTEIEDYHERVTNLQYFPSKAESEFLMKNIPVEISGDASEDIEVSNYKDLPRVETNRIRSGYCLIHSSCIPLKAPKLWKEIGKWGASVGLEHWNFLEKFLKIQKEAKAAKTQSGDSSKRSADKSNISPDFTYIKDIVAGRPVIGHPLRNGAFRLRYGRSRTSGFSAQSIHPATMHVLNNFIATGTQLKVERPGKGAAFTACDTINGPIVKLTDGSVLALNSESEAKHIKRSITEILYLGDVLVNYGDFLNRAHPLVPAGYCEEWWIQELAQTLKQERPETERPEMDASTDTLATRLEFHTKIPVVRAQQFFDNCFVHKPTPQEAITITQNLGVPLHPSYTHYWNSITKPQLESLLDWLSTAKIEPVGNQHQKLVVFIVPEPKRHLEIAGVPHKVSANEYTVIEDPHASILLFIFPFIQNKDRRWKEQLNTLLSQKPTFSTLEIINAFTGVPLRDKCGTFIGSRMGRPEKAKQRELTGSPHTLFPVGDEGGRLRSFQAALEIGTVHSDIALFYCKKCNAETPFGVCDRCDQKA
ncbi:hypothetical protein HY772_04540, partial [Candidatus Woesearchaeota archaeon]|nr:hypothetical protein [Candidatus Woesearchaeota archaeon]